MQKESNPKKILILSILIVLLIILLNLFFGICFIHEYTHYFIGKSFGCQNLRIECNNQFSLSKIDSVQGWSSCDKIVNTGLQKVCNIKTYTVLIMPFLSTFILYSIFALLLIIPISNLSKINYYDFLPITITGVFFETFRTASFDFANIISCFFLMDPNITGFYLVILSIISYTIFCFIWLIYKKYSTKI